LFEELTNSIKFDCETLQNREISQNRETSHSPSASIMTLRIKICGITQPAQGQAIAALGVNALGFICVPASPRYVSPAQIRQVSDQLLPTVSRIGVFMDADVETMVQTATIGQLTSIQLHGVETEAICTELRDRLPEIELIKAFRVRSGWELEMAAAYAPAVDWLLLDAYHPDLGGGTGKTIDWQTLAAFKPDKPWFLAGGLNPANINQALSLTQPNGIDLSSGVEHAPGDKNINAVNALLTQLSC
jgi:phosphoribosylanthranilate isomerase